jgi:hypothetical protein
MGEVNGKCALQSPVFRCNRSYRPLPWDRQRGMMATVASGPATNPAKRMFRDWAPAGRLRRIHRIIHLLSARPSFAPSFRDLPSCSAMLPVNYSPEVYRHFESAPQRVEFTAQAAPGVEAADASPAFRRLPETKARIARGVRSTIKPSAGSRVLLPLLITVPCPALPIRVYRR